MYNLNILSDHMNAMRKKEALKGKILVYIIYYICLLAFFPYLKFSEWIVQICVFSILILVLTLIIEQYLMLNKVYYSIKFILLVFILNSLFFEFKIAFAVTTLSYALYMYERRRELIQIYKSLIKNKTTDNRTFALSVATATIILLRLTDPNYDSNLWQYIVILAINIFFAIEFNLINDLYDPSYIKLLRIDKYIESNRHN